MPEPRIIARALLFAVFWWLPSDAAAESFVMPKTGTLLVEVIRDDGAEWTFGVGSSEADFREVIRNTPALPVGEVELGSFPAGETIHFGVWTRFGGVEEWAFSNRNDPPSRVVFQDGGNLLGLGGNVIEQILPDVWILHLDNAASVPFDDDNDDIVIRMRLVRPPCDATGNGVVDSADLQAQISALSASAGIVSYLSNLVRNAQLYLDRGNNTTARSRFADLIVEIVRLSNMNTSNGAGILLDQGNALAGCTVEVLAGIDLPQPHVPGSGVPPPPPGPTDPPVVR
jgi:hypothetical protein